MERDVQAVHPAEELLTVAAEVTPTWLRRITIRAAERGGVDGSRLEPSLGVMVEVESKRVLQELAELLAVDVDLQRTNPLTVFRAAVAGPTELLRDRRVPTPPTDPFVAERFPNDIYHLGPASFADVDQRLHEPGLAWGAWKALTVLRRRRDEGLR